VDVTSRTLDARMLSAQEVAPRGLPVRTAKAAGSMLRPYVNTLQRITTDDGNEFTDLFQSTLRSELELPGLQFLRISKGGLSQTHPGKLAPVETAVRSVREHLEKYRRLYTQPHYTQPHYTQPDGLHNIVSSFNRTKNAAFLLRHSPNEFVRHSKEDGEGVRPSEYFHKYREAIRDVQAKAISVQQLKIGEIVRVRRGQSAFWKQSYQQMTCFLYKVMRIENHYLVTLRRLKYPDGGYQEHIPDILESEGQPARNIHITRLCGFILTISTTLLLIHATKPLYEDYDKRKTKQVHNMFSSPFQKRTEMQVYVLQSSHLSNQRQLTRMYYDHGVPVLQKQAAILTREHIKEHGGSYPKPSLYS
jgi:hypothetical protein